MIKSVRVKNYILIDELTLDFDEGFNVFTGETGAGKSIIIGAIDAALGAKVSKDVIKTGSDKALVELLIEHRKGFDNKLFEKNGIEIDDEEIVVSLEISPSSTRSRINGTLVNRDFIKEIREKLVDIHSQHQSYNYVQQKNHIDLLDNFALPAHGNNINLFCEKYKKYSELQKKLEELKNISETAMQQREFIKFQCDEIEKANITDIDEDEILKKELEVLMNIEKIKELSYSSYWALNGDDINVLNILSKIKSNLAKLSSMDESIVPLEENFVNTYETIKEMSSELRSYSESKENDAERSEYINERLSILDKIKRKYGGTLEAVLNTYEKLSEELRTIECSQDETVKVENEITTLKQELETLSNIISGARKELAGVLSKAVSAELEKLELPKSKFEISVEPCEMNIKGTDRVEFMITTNVSEGLKPLAKTASGGEISRIMLALKTVFAKADNTDTVIFDEIDTGISGKASQAVADEISGLAKTHQVIIITHQPIIAAKASKHFYVKKLQEDVTKVNVYTLEKEERIKALALLAAGEINSDSLSFARNLLGISHYEV